MDSNKLKYSLIIALTFAFLGLTAQPDVSFKTWYGEQAAAVSASTISINTTNIPDSIFTNEHLSNNNIKLGTSIYTDSYYSMLLSLDKTTVCNIWSAWHNHKHRFESICRELEIPQELAVLPFAISAMNWKAIDLQGNTGSWQLHYLTAIKYGLRIESFYDERLDPYLSAEAALKHLKSLHEITNSWPLAITAYSSGIPLLEKTKTACNCSHPDSLYSYLPANIRNTYPMLLATLRLTEKLEAYSRILPMTMPKPVLSKVEINNRLHFEQISSVLQISISDLSAYNPLFTDVVIDGRKKAIALNLPPDKANDYELLKDSIANYLDSIYFPKPVIEQITYTESGSVAIKPGNDYERIDYIIVPGDNLGAIAETFDVAIVDLRDWNGLIGNSIYAGKKLFIYKLKEDAKRYRNISHKETTKQEKAVIPEGSKEIVYIVKSGDSPYSIAKKYDGVSDFDIVSWNGINDPSKLRLGQELKIYIVE